MLKNIHNYQPGAVVTLVPNTGIQFLDFGLKLDDARQVQLSFWAEQKLNEVDEAGRPAVELHLLERDEEGGYFFHRTDGSKGYAPEEDVLTLRGDKALDSWAGEWLPIPYLRLTNEGMGDAARYADGPSNWARLFVTKLDDDNSNFDDKDEQGHDWRLTIALDTLLVERPPARRNEITGQTEESRYVAPEPRDAEDDMRFGLASHLEDLRFFLNTDWIRQWLRESYLARLTRSKGGRRQVQIEDLNNPVEYLAHFVTALAAVRAKVVTPQLRFLDEKRFAQRPGMQAGGEEIVPVSLVIDVGNSRTCGILIEDSEGSQRLDLSQAFRLEMRDLSRPSHVYFEPFESRGGVSSCVLRSVRPIAIVAAAKTRRVLVAKPCPRWTRGCLAGFSL